MGSTAARVEPSDDMSFKGMFTADRIDVNKCGMVSKAEFLAMMGKAWDMKSKEMNVKGDQMNAKDDAAFAGFLSRGVKNKQGQAGLVQNWPGSSVPGPSSLNRRAKP